MWTCHKWQSHYAMSCLILKNKGSDPLVRGLSLLFEVLLLVEKASWFNLEGGNILLSESGKKQYLFIYVIKKILHFKIACKLWHLIMWWSIRFCGFPFSIRFNSMMENFFRSLMPYTYLLPLPQPPTTSLDPFQHYASSITTIFMNFFHRCFINFSKLKHKCENVSPLITCSITPINHHGIFSDVKHFSSSHIN
jgi:hypothetical protein